MPSDQADDSIDHESANFEELTSELRDSPNQTVNSSACDREVVLSSTDKELDPSRGGVEERNLSQQRRPDSLHVPRLNLSSLSSKKRSPHSRSFRESKVSSSRRFPREDQERSIRRSTQIGSLSDRAAPRFTRPTSSSKCHASPRFQEHKMAPGERQPWKISDTRSLPNADERTPAENSFYPVYKYSNETMSFMSKLRMHDKTAESPSRISISPIESPRMNRMCLSARSKYSDRCGNFLSASETPSSPRRLPEYMRFVENPTVDSPRGKESNIFSGSSTSSLNVKLPDAFHRAERIIQQKARRNMELNGPAPSMKTSPLSSAPALSLDPFAAASYIASHPNIDFGSLSGSPASKYDGHFTPRSLISDSGAHLPCSFVGPRVSDEAEMKCIFGGKMSVSNIKFATTLRSPVQPGQVKDARMEFGR